MWHPSPPASQFVQELCALLQGIFPTQESNPGLMSPALASRFFPQAKEDSELTSQGPAGREKGLSTEQGRQTEREEEEEKWEEAEAREKAVPEEESPPTAAFKPPPSLGNKETQRGETVYDV